MTYAELRASLEANEHEHALKALERIRYSVLEARVSRAEAAAEQERLLRYEHTITENDELNRLRAEVWRLKSENAVLRQASREAAPAPPVERIPEPRRPARPHVPLPKPRQPQSAIMASALVQRMLAGEPAPEPPEPGTFDPTIDDEEMA